MKPSKIQQLAKCKLKPPMFETAESLFAKKLEGDDLNEAFAALDETEKARFVDDPRRWMASSIDANFN